MVNLCPNLTREHSEPDDKESSLVTVAVCTYIGFLCSGRIMMVHKDRSYSDTGVSGIFTYFQYFLCIFQNLKVLKVQGKVLEERIGTTTFFNSPLNIPLPH